MHKSRVCVFIALRYNQIDKTTVLYLPIEVTLQQQNLLYTVAMYLF